MISAVLVAGLSVLLPAVVSAAPGDKETTERISYNDDDDAARKAEGAWVEIADPTPAKHGKVYIPVGASAGQFTRVRIDVDKGRPRVRSVRIDFENGRSRVMKVEMTLHKGKGKGKAKSKRASAYVDLGGAREIDQVVVITDRSSKGSYTVHAEAGSGGVASR